MERFTRWLTSRMIEKDESPRDPRVRARFGMLEGWVSIVVNLLLAAGKLVLGIIMHSAGLISDAVHSLGDMATSLVVIVGFRVSRKPPDPEHPFGHEKSEQIATLIISVLLVIAGFELGKETLLALISDPGGGAEDKLTWGLGAILVGMMLIKEVLAKFSYALAKIIVSSTLQADGWHHRTDALTTGIVIIGLAGRNFGWPWLDGIAGLMVSLFIIGTGIQMAYVSISPLLGETAVAEEIDIIKVIGQKVQGINSIHDIRVQRYGKFNFTTLHVELSDRIGVHRMHEITVQIETRILKKFPGECVVHIDPIDFYHPMFNQVADLLRSLVIAHPDLVDFQDLKLWRENGGEHGDVEISVEPEAPGESYSSLNTYVLREVEKRFPALRFQVWLKVDFSATPLHG